MTDEPNQVRQKNQERDCGADPKFSRDQKTPFARQGESNYNGNDEERDAVFRFHPDTNEGAKPDPVTWIISIDRADNAPDAADPS